MSLLLLVLATGLLEARTPPAPPEAVLPPDSAPNGLLDAILAPSAAGAAARPAPVPPGAGPPGETLPVPGEHPGPALTTRRAGHVPPTVAEPGSRVVPYGHGVAKLTCVPGRACDIRLEPGEVIDGLVLGDPEGWSVTELAEGAGELTPHVLVMPVRHDTTTNLVIVTDRRTYHLELAAPPEPEGDEVLAYGHLAFRYPGAWVRRLRDDEARRAAAAKDDDGAGEEPEAAVEGVAPGELSFAWELERPWRKRHRLRWEPVTVFDDGRHTYVKLPAASRAGPLPALLGRRPDGTTFPVNARLEGDLYVVPAVLPELELVIGTGKSRRWLRLLHAGREGER